MKRFFVLVMILHLSKASLEIDLLGDYLRWKNVKIVTVFHCIDQTDENALGHSYKIAESFLEKIRFEDIANFSEATWNHKHVMKYDYHKLGVTVDLGCPRTAKLFEVVSKNEYFKASYHWLLFANGSLEEATALLGVQNLNIDAKVTLVVDQDQDAIYDVFDVFSPSISRGAALNTTFMGTWSRESGIGIVVNQTEYERRVDFAGISLIAAVTVLAQEHHTSLLQQLTSNEPTATYSLQRFGYRMLEILLEKHNFSVKLIKSTTTLGSEADLSMNCITYTKEKITELDYSVTVGVSRTLIVFRHPRNIGRNFFLRPFRLELWIAILVINLLAAVVVYATFGNKSSKQYNDPQTSDDRGLAWLTVFGVLFQQGTSSTISLNSTRIALLSTLIFSILVSQFYSSYIVGYLLIVPPKTMHTLQHLLDSNLKVIVENQDYNVDYLKETKDPIAIELYQRKILNDAEDNFMNVTEGIARVKRGGYAFQCDTSYAYPLVRGTFTDKEICDLQETALSPMRPVHLPLRKGSPFREMFRVTLRKALETANAKYQQKAYFAERPKCDKNDLETVAVDLDHLLTMYYALFGGMVGSFVIMILEWGYAAVISGKGRALPHRNCNLDPLKED